ncbi:MAG: hypothetical protein JWR55_2396 [Aeromicrobium sp.]|jgi:hypothetical protein|nr:hypothetical protein [Aeromicrobium sp.]
MKISLALAGVVLLGTSLAACGGGDDSGSGGGDGDYCKDLKSAQATFAKVSGNDFDALDSAIATFHKLADEAPDDVKTEWETLDGAFLKIEKAFDEAGIKMSDLPEIQAGNIPEGVDVSKLTSLASTFSEISSDKVTKAQATIEKHAKDSCDVDLGAS